MEEYMCGDIWTYFQDVGTRVYRYWVYKKIFTPLEMAEKYTDQDIYEDSYCKFGIIRECVELPNGDFLLGFEDVPCDGDYEGFKPSIEYYKLSEVHLSYHPSDMELLEGKE